MEELKIYDYQAKEIANTLRIVANILKAHKKITCANRDIIHGNVGDYF